jgi:hypothetical protein
LSNPLVEAFVKVELGNRYKKAMEGIGRVTFAVTLAESIVDVIGCYLEGEQAYEKRSKRKPTGPKIKYVKKMCETRISDPSLKNRIDGYCDSLSDFVQRRNDIVHSLYLQIGEQILRIKITPRKVEPITSDELFQLAHQIWTLYSEHATELISGFEKAMQDRSA